MSGGAPAPVARVLCPLCQADAIDVGFTQRGELAAHLVDTHLMGASKALREARQAFGEEPAPVVTPADRAAIAKRLGVKAAHPIVSDLITRAGAVEAPRPAMEASVAEPKTKKPVRLRTRTKGAGDGAPCSYCKRRDGTHAPSCYRGKPAGARKGGAARGAARNGNGSARASLSGAAAEIRAAIAVKERELAALKEALAIIG